MRYVLDSSVGFKWPVIELDTPKTRRLRDDFRDGVHELLALGVFPVEIAHALSRAERQGQGPVSLGSLFLADVLATLPQLFPGVPLLPRAYEISSHQRIGAYVALAEREGCPFITADDRLIRALQPLFPFLVSLASFP